VPPIPKRTDQLRRRNQKWVDKIAGGVGRPDAAPVERPPKTGPGSSVEAWREYANAVGHTVPPNATRKDVIALVEAGLSIEEAWDPLVRDWYRSLSESAQSVFYEPSDWATARVLAELLSRALKSGKVSASLVERWQAGATELLTTEGARRRMRLEIERPQEGGEEGGADVSEMDEWRRRLHGD
jgi:hypothetical protein